jgi:hypothetical protein
MLDFVLAEKKAETAYLEFIMSSGIGFRTMLKVIEVNNESCNTTSITESLF